MFWEFKSGIAHNIEAGRESFLEEEVLELNLEGCGDVTKF